MFKYNALTHKKPCGGVNIKENIHIDFPISLEIDAHEVFIVIRNGNSLYLKLPLKKGRIKDNYCHYVVDFTIEKSGIYKYRFEVITDIGMLFIGSDTELNAVRGDWLPEFQLTVSNPSYNTNKCSGGLIYHIFVDRFKNSGKIPFNKNGRLKKWGDKVDIHDEYGNYDAQDFYGGDLYGIIEKLDYLKQLNVTHIYLSPIFESSSNHRYDTGDYSKIDSLLGGEQAYYELIFKARENGIGIILDGVFNHTGADSVYFNRFNNYSSVGAYQSDNSPYYDWYTFFNFPSKYAAWWGMTCVPTLNKNSIGVKDYFLGSNSIIDKWSKTGIAGWRLDVVDELPVDYVDAVVSKIKNTDKDIMVIGEVWEDASLKVSYDVLRPYFTKPQLDGVMNYVFYNAIIDYILTNDIKKFKKDVSQIINNYPKHALDNSMTLLGSHDTVRIINRLAPVDVKGTTKKMRQGIVLKDNELSAAIMRLKVAVMLQFTLPGIPSIYYGDEIGLQGYEDPLNRACFPWDSINYDILDYYKKISHIRTQFKDTIRGDFQFVVSNDIVIYDRIGKKERIRVLINNTNKEKNYYVSNARLLLDDTTVVETFISIKPHTAALLLYADKE